MKQPERIIPNIVSHRVGELAYFDSVHGMLPCKVIDVLEEGKGSILNRGLIQIKFTAHRPGYKKGDTYLTSASNVIPRDHYKRGVIMVNYEWRKS